MALLPVALALAFCGGVAVALVLPMAPTGALLLLVVCSVGGAVAAWRRHPALVLSCGLLGTAWAGVALGTEADQRARHPRLPALLDQRRSDGVVALVGVLEEDASIGPNGARVRLSVRRFGDDEVDLRETVALTVGGTLAGPHVALWRAGRSVRLLASLRRPSCYLNPGVPDDRLALARHGTTLVGSVKSATLVDVLALGAWRQERAAEIRAHVRAAIATHVLPHDRDAGAVATAILIGDRTDLDAALERRLQIAGTYHVIAISGGNIAVLTATLLGLAHLLGLRHRLGHLAVALLLLFHAGVVGGGASVERATAMAVIYLALRTVDQSASGLNALATAAGGLVAARPLTMVDPGFVLSVGATGAIIVLATTLAGRRSPISWRRAACEVVLASVATELVLLPVAATYFNRVTVAGLVLNLAAVPLMAVVQVAASLTVLADPVALPPAALFGFVTAWAARGLTASAALVDWWPWLALRMPAPSGWVAIGYGVSLALAMTAPSLLTPSPSSSARLRRVSVAGAVACAIWIVLAPSTWRWPWRADGWLRVVAIDVGQGDATLLEFPDGRRWLVDAGGLAGATRFDVGERVVAPSLWDRGTGRLDVLVLTHGDPDHIGGAAAVMDDFGPAVFDGVPVPAHVPLRTLRAHADARGHVWGQLTRGDVRDVAGVQVRVWHPRRPEWERQKVRNDDSIVIDLRYRDVSVVLPGDISAEVEDALASEIPPARVRVLKAAHHGSATSTSQAWLDALDPDVVLFSCGRDNRYGHPAPAVLERVRERGATVFRTDEDGQVVVETDGKALRVTTFTGRAYETTTKARRREGAKD